MPRDGRNRTFLCVESLEGRALLSGLGRIHASAIKVNAGGEAAILGALRGGVGSEFATLIRREVRNPSAVIGGFVSGKVATFSAPGIAFREPAAQSAFAGTAYDQLLPTAAGAALFKGDVLELAAVLRGPFHDPSSSQYVFALDRGAGAGLGPAFAGRPGITPDVTVTITAGPYGQSPSGTIRDLTDGSTRAIDPSKISIKGATLRVFLEAGQLPSKGAPPSGYKFALWTQSRPGTDLADVAEFLPDDAMVPIAVAKTIAVHR